MDLFVEQEQAARQPGPCRSRKTTGRPRASRNPVCRVGIHPAPIAVRSPSGRSSPRPASRFGSRARIGFDQSAQDITQRVAQGSVLSSSRQHLLNQPFSACQRSDQPTLASAEPAYREPAAPSTRAASSNPQAT